MGKKIIKLKDLLGMMTIAIFMAMAVVSYEPKVSYKLSETKKDIITVEESEYKVNEETLKIDLLN